MGNAFFYFIFSLKFWKQKNLFFYFGIYLKTSKFRRRKVKLANLEPKIRHLKKKSCPKTQNPISPPFFDFSKNICWKFFLPPSSHVSWITAKSHSDTKIPVIRWRELHLLYICYEQLNLLTFNNKLHLKFISETFQIWLNGKEKCDLEVKTKVE